MNNLEILGARIKSRRTELNMSQAELAARAGYSSRSSVNKIEKGIVDIPQSKIKLLAEILSVSEAWLMGYDVPMERYPARTDVEKIDYARSPLYQKILLLDEEDQGRVDGFVSGLLSSSKYQNEEKTYQIQIAARGGGLKQITLTESQMAAILNAPEVTDLGGKS